MAKEAKVEIEVIIRFKNGTIVQEHKHLIADHLALAVTRGAYLHLQTEHPWHGTMVQAGVEER